MPTSTKKKPVNKKLSNDNHDPLSSSGVSSLSGIGLYSTKKIVIYKNGDRFHRGVKFVINPRVIKDMEPLLNQMNDRIDLSHGVKKLYTADGKVVKSIKDLEDGKIYVAASAQFIAMRYGDFQEKVWKPPSRKHSPILSDTRIKTARTRSQEPRAAAATRKSREHVAAVQTRSMSVKNLTTRDREREKKKTTNGAAPMRAVPAKKIPPPAKPPSKAPPKPAPAPAPAPRPKAKQPPATKPPSRRKTPKTSTSMASSVMPEPEIVKAAEILEFPEEKRVIDVVTIHKTPTPPGTTENVASNHHSEEEEEEFSSDGEEEEESASGSEGEESGEAEEEEDEEEEVEDEEESVGTDSEVNTPSSRKSTSSSVESGVEHDEQEEKKKKSTKT